MATDSRKARECVAREWLLQNYCINQVIACKHEVITDQSITRQMLAEELLAAYEAETIERCAQIADGLEKKSEEEVREFRRLCLSGCAMQSQSEMSAYRSAAAAIRALKGE